MKRKTQIARPVSQQKVKLDSFMFYTVLSLAALAAVTSYSAGASIEASFLRAVVVLLICTILGYALNIAMDLSARNQMLTTVLDTQGSEISLAESRPSQNSPAQPDRNRKTTDQPAAQPVAPAQAVAATHAVEADEPAIAEG
jgi:hypothetical protein